MKAVIVFDVDSDFDFDQKLWVQIEEYLDGEILESGCYAVKPLPQVKEEAVPYQVSETEVDCYQDPYATGWNDCLEELVEE